MKKSLLIAFFALAFSGCAALHTPQSEILLFEPEEEGRSNRRGFSVGSSILSRDMTSYAVDTHKREGSRSRLARRNFYGLSFSFGKTRKRSAFGTAFGSGGVGLDYTYAHANKVYLTLAGNAARNFDAVVQVPVYRRANSGLGVGVFYRNERHGLLEDCKMQGYFCLGIKIGTPYRVSAIGVRIAQYLDDDKGRLRIRFSLGYSPELRGIVITGNLHAGYPK